MPPSSASDVNLFLANIVRGPSAVFCALYGISCGVHIWQSKKYNSWTHTWTLPCACIMMMAGFICREITAENHDPNDLASPIQGLFYVAVAIFTVPIYTLVLLSPDILELAPWIRPSLCYILIWGITTAVITTTSNGSSTYYNANAPQDELQSDLTVLKLSLFLQLGLNGVLVCLIKGLLLELLFTRRKRRNRNEGTTDRISQPVALLLSAGALLSLIIIRNVFRTIQLYSPPTSQIWVNEAYFWVFEGCVMLGFTTLFHFLHLGQYDTS